METTRLIAKLSSIATRCEDDQILGKTVRLYKAVFIFVKNVVPSKYEKKLARMDDDDRITFETQVDLCSRLFDLIAIAPALFNGSATTNHIMDNISDSYGNFEDSLRFFTHQSPKEFFTVTELLDMSNDDFDNLCRTHTTYTSQVDTLWRDHFNANENDGFELVQVIQKEAKKSSMLLYNVKVNRMVKSISLH